MTRFLSSAAAFALMSWASPAFAQTYFLDNATFVSDSGQRQTGDAIWTDGEITRRGAELSAPDGAETISNAWITSGLFASMSSLGLTDLGSSGSGNDISAGGAPTSVSERAADSFNPKAAQVADTRRRGITHALVAPSTSGDSIFAGTGAIIDLTGGFDSIVREDAFVMIDLGERGGDRAGGSRAAAFAQLRGALEDALRYPGRFSAPNDGDALSRQDARALAPAAKGDMPLIIQANRAADLINIIKLSDDFPALDIIIVSATEAWQVASDLADADIRVIIDPLANLPASFESIGARLDNAVILENAGVDFAIANLSSFRVAQPAILNQHAGNAVGDGLPWETAFAAISSVPASWFGIDAQTRVVWDGDPLQATSAPIAISIDGQAQPLNSRQTALRDRYNPTKGEAKPHKYR